MPLLPADDALQARLLHGLPEAQLLHLLYVLRFLHERHLRIVQVSQPIVCVGVRTAMRGARDSVSSQSVSF